ncbi:VCBS repeat-containing protein [uncultured Ruegeria sp.]|uniref:FG-GAP repeat domain-containing protein n=1 Tax=uncultured Ruegeria sp. TaxID=259304 RepID=UPI00260ED633|nr:VCBS repeat-containing protein [uncultured Ruegeria sp.]
MSSWPVAAVAIAFGVCPFQARSQQPWQYEPLGSAEYAEPTSRYPHGVLGDQIEYGALVLQYAPTWAKYTIRLPKERVFEDIQPRLVDIDNDNRREALVVESHRDKGARLAIYNGGGLIAATPYIGTRFRWLAPIGAADLDGDGHIEIAYIDRPHLANTLRIWRFKDGGLAEVAALPGLTNHRISEDFISGGLRTCGDRPELIVASADWSRIVSVSYDNGWIKSDLGPFKGHNSLAQALNC